MENMVPEHPHHSSGEKFAFSFNGIDWKKEVMNAIEILKLNKAKMQEVAKDTKATTVGLVFMIVPQLVSLVLYIIVARGFIGWIHGMYLLGIIAPFLCVYAVHFCATKFFQGKGDLLHYFRVVSYTNIITVISLAVTILMSVGMDLSGLYSLSTIAVGIWMLIVSYYTLMETYHVNSQNTIITLVIATVAVGIIVTLANNILFPNPWDDLSKTLRGINGLR